MIGALNRIIRAIGAYNPGSGATQTDSPGVIPALLSGASSVVGLNPFGIFD